MVHEWNGMATVRKDAAADTAALPSPNAAALPLTVRLRAPHSRGTVDRFRVPALVSQQCNGQYKLVLLSRHRQQRAHA